MLSRGALSIQARALKGIARATPCMQTRAESTDAASSEYQGSKNYVPGKQGYAPGFPPPRNWPAEPREPPKPQLASDLAVPTTKKQIDSRSSNPEQNATRLYKQKLREMRFSYQYDHLVKQQAKREQQEESLERVKRYQANRKEKLRQEWIEYDTKVRSDPLSAENVLNSEGKTLLSNIPGEESHADQHQPAVEASEEDSANAAVARPNAGQPGYKLAPPRVSISIPKEANELRAQERTRNRELTQERRHEQKVQALMALFHEAESFVHYHNLEKKIYEFTNLLSVSHRTLGELVDDMNSNGGVTTSPEVARRTVELRNTLQGTTGRKGEMGMDGLIEWLDSHPEDADGIHHLDTSGDATKK